MYGIRGPAYNLFTNYLGHRKQFTLISDAKSTVESVVHGVPQGSVLGPILFLLYINDLPRCSSILNFLLFADDTSIFLQGNNLHLLALTLNKELINVSKWIKSNKLTLNTEKTFFMLSQPLMVKELKFLGVTIDSRLTWKSHIHDVSNKISKISGIIYRVRHLLNDDCIKHILLSRLSTSHLLFCVMGRSL